MKIDIIVPTNNIKDINGFIASFDKLVNFKKYCTLKIIANGDVTYKSILGFHSVNYDLIRVDKNYLKQIVPFAKLRYEGMKNSRCDYFLFLDDDHRFNKDSDAFLTNCLRVLIKLKDCSVLCTDKNKNGNYGLKIKKDGFIWTNKGLFIKNIINDSFIYDLLLGAGEDLLFSYIALYKEGLAYEMFGSDITRVEKRHINGKVLKNISYEESTMNKNIIGFLRFIFSDSKWVHKSDNENVRFPFLLQRKISSRMIK